MLSKQRKEQIEHELEKKGINKQSQHYVIQYIDINQQLFGSFLNIDELQKRIINNLSSNIKYIPTTLKEIVKFLKNPRDSSFNTKERKIAIAPILKLKSFTHRGKEKLDSIIRHELDHSATTTYIDISDEEKDKLINEFMLNNNISNSKENAIKKLVDRRLLRDRKLGIVGIHDDRKLSSNLDLRELNEGITAYKQDLYDEFLGSKKKYSNYKYGKKMAELIVSVIGKEKLIRAHFNNDYEQIISAYKGATGKDIKSLLDILDKQPKMKKTSVFIRLNPLTRPIYWYRKHKYKVESQEYSERLDTYASYILHKKGNNKSFVPKVKINEAEILESLKDKREQSTENKKIVNDNIQE